MSEKSTAAPTSLRPAPFVSLVIPVYNEEEVLPQLLDRLTEVGKKLTGGWEALFIDDGSRDGTARIVTEAHRREPRFQLVQLQTDIYRL